MKLTKLNVAGVMLTLAAGIGGLTACGSVKAPAPAVTHTVAPQAAKISPKQQLGPIKPTPTSTYVMAPQANHNPAHNPSGS